ncbi:MAG TPA: septum formation initiator family protein [Stellaceae bacterium]|nr:septum formation initiator family protein [Stellaceae bacterium]
MEVGRFIRREARGAVIPLVCFALAVYFAYHLVEGDRGVLAWTHLMQQIREAKADAAKVHNERMEQEHRVSLLRSDNLDPDMLDEQARARLNLAAPGEVVILDDDQQK